VSTEFAGRRMLRPGEVAAVLGVTSERVRQLARRGLLAHVHTAGGRLFDVDELIRYARTFPRVHRYRKERMTAA
jgi:hypothetical protein